MLICLDMRTGAGCGTENPNYAQLCSQCGKALRFGLMLHDAKTVVEDYQVVRVIGYGAYGAVYEAVDYDQKNTSPLTRFFSRYLLGNSEPDEAAERMALKETFDASNISSFEREFSVLSNLDHANLPRYLDVFEANGNGYLVMEYVPGQSLQEILDARTELLPESQILGYALQLCDVLTYLHSQQPPILHRDIKPANIRLTPEGRIKLVDFGLLKQGGHQTRATIRGLGTPAYAPLEQYGDNQQATNVRSDIYSLGATLYHLLSGQELPSAPNLLGGAALHPLPSVRSSAVRDAVMKAMSLLPQDRFANMNEFRQALAGQPSVEPASVIIEVPVEVKIEENKDDKEDLSPIAQPNSPSSLDTRPIAEQNSPSSLNTRPISLNTVPLTSPEMKPASEEVPVSAPSSYFYSVLPALLEQGMTRRIGRGIPRKAIVLPDESVIVIAGGGAVRLHMHRSEPMWEIDCPAACGALSPDGKLLALANYNEIYLWDLQTGTLSHTLRGHTGEINSVTFSPTGILASGSSDKTIRLWNQSGQSLHVFEGHSRTVKCIAFSSTGMLASSSYDKTVRLWDSQGNSLHVFTKYTDSVQDLAFSPSGRILAWACAIHDSTVRLWDMQGHLLTTFSKHWSSVNSVTFIDEETIASAGCDETVRLWNTRGRELDCFTEHTDDINSVTYGSTGILASASDDNTVRLWDLNGFPLHCFSEHSGQVSSVAFTSNGSFLALGAFDDKTVYLWEVLSTEHTLHRLERVMGRVTSVAASPDGRFLALGSEDHLVHILNLRRKKWKKCSGHHKIVTCVAISPDSRLLASGGRDKTIRLWDMSGRLKRVLSGHTGWVKSVAFSPDGKLLASASGDHTVRLWNMQGKLLQTLTLHTNSVQGVAFSPTGLLASAGYERTVQLWDMSRHKALTDHSGPVRSVAFSAQSMLASASDDRTVRLWDIRGRKLDCLKGHSDDVESVAFSPDGQLLASASKDHTVRLWDVKKQAKQAEKGVRIWQEVRRKRRK